MSRTVEAPRPDGRRAGDGYVPLGDYAALGDGRTVALVARDGRVDWWPVPTTDAPPAFAAVLDPEDGGHLALAPEAEARVERRYLPDTNVLETTFTTGTGTVRVTDAFNVGVAGRLPWHELVRRVEGVSGQVRMRWSVVPGTRFGTARPWTSHRDGTVVLHVGDQHYALRAFDVGDVEAGAHEVGGRVTTAPGSRHLLGVVATDGEPVYLPRRDALERRLDRTVRFWQDWAGYLAELDRWRGPVRRSALALELLRYAPTGAIAAAPTTSLPESPGGEANWDYRYAWVRDSSFALDAFIRLGLHEEVHATVSWMLGVIRAMPAGYLRPFATLDGHPPADEQYLDVPGYRESRPVRDGNRAGGQRQLGSYGDLFDTVHRYVREGHVLDVRTGRLLADLADQCCDVWRRQDCGIWELPERAHYTTSKIGCWTALDRAVRLAEAGHLPDAHVGRWVAERDDIRAWVDRYCWSERKQAYTMHAGTEDLDAAVLLAARVGFDRGKRLQGTVEAVRAELAHGPLVYRYGGAVGREGAFLACSFWLVMALAHLDRVDEACALMDEVVGRASDVGLFAEEQDPATGEMLGNIPQGLSHLALVNAAFTVLDVTGETPEAARPGRDL